MDNIAIGDFDLLPYRKHITLTPWVQNPATAVLMPASNKIEQL